MKAKKNFTKSVLFKQSFPRKVNLKSLSRVLHGKNIKEEKLKHKKNRFLYKPLSPKKFLKDHINGGTQERSKNLKPRI